MALNTGLPKRINKKDFIPYLHQFGLINPADGQVVDVLMTREIGTLDLDKLISDPVLSNFDPHLLRVHLIKVYYSAAARRKERGASKEQIRAAEGALEALERAGDLLKRLGQGTLLETLGISIKKTAVGGQSERHDLAMAADEINGLIAKSIIKLRHALDQKKGMPKAEGAGRRSGRLRTLVEEFDKWWLQEVSPKYGFRIAASRSVRKTGMGKRKKRIKSVDAPFLKLAIALFSKLDGFSETEVRAAVNNVMSRRKRRRLSP